MSVRLDDLAAAVRGLPLRRAGSPGDPEIRSVVHDTRDVAAGSLFCCVRGARADGHDLAPAAVAAGAAALLVDHALPLPVPQLMVADVRAAMGPVAAAFWGHPSRRARRWSGSPAPRARPRSPTCSGPCSRRPGRPAA